MVLPWIGVGVKLKQSALLERILFDVDEIEGARRLIGLALLGLLTVREDPEDLEALVKPATLDRVNHDLLNFVRHVFLVPLFGFAVKL